MFQNYFNKPITEIHTCNLCLTEYEHPEQSDSAGEIDAAADAARVWFKEFTPDCPGKCCGSFICELDN